MKKLYACVTWVLVAFATPTIALAGNQVKHKEVNHNAVFSTHSSWVSFDDMHTKLADKTIIKSGAPSYGSFQDQAELKSWWKKAEDKHDWLAEDDHGKGRGHHHDDDWDDHFGWEDHGHGGHHGHDWYDPVTQPVPEPSTYLMLALGLFGLMMVKRRQY